MSRKDYLAQCESEVKDFMLKNKVLLQYQRDNKNRPVGVVIAFKDGEVLKIGYSKCNTKAEPFNKYVGAKLAIRRATPPRLFKDLTPDFSPRDLPRSLKGIYEEMLTRSIRYFFKST